MQIAQTDFSIDCMKMTQEYLMYFKEFSCNIAENMQARCVTRFIQRFLKYFAVFSLFLRQKIRKKVKQKIPAKRLFKPLCGVYFLVRLMRFETHSAFKSCRRKPNKNSLRNEIAKGNFLWYA